MYTDCADTILSSIESKLIKVKETLLKHGYAIVDQISTEEKYLNFAKALGKILKQKDSVNDEEYVIISEKTKIKKSGFTNNALFPHTDRSVLKNPPDLIMLWCKHMSAKGGESTLVDMRKIIHFLVNNDENFFSHFCSHQVIFSDEDYSNYYRGYFIDEKDGKLNVRFRNDRFIFIPPECSKYFFKMVELIKNHQIMLKLEENQILIVDNKRMLHGREAFFGHRKLLRLHLETEVQYGI